MKFKPKAKFHVYPEGDADKILFEGGSRAACLDFLKRKNLRRAWKRGEVRIAEVVWESASCIQPNRAVRQNKT
jgi:hypothetical protein